VFDSYAISSVVRSKIMALRVDINLLHSHRYLRKTGGGSIVAVSLLGGFGSSFLGVAKEKESWLVEADYIHCPTYGARAIGDRDHKSNVMPNR